MIRIASIVFAAATLAPAAHAFPTKPVKLYVPSGPGVPPDIVARLVATPLSARIGQPIVVENRPGTHAATSVAEAAADGHTLGLAHTGFVLAPSLVRSAGYDVVKSFAPVGRIATTALLVLVSGAVPATSLAELVALARAKPRELNFVAATGTLPHLAGHLFMSAAAIELTPVPYKTASLAYPDLAAGRVQMMFDTIGPHLANVRAGKVRALAVAGPKRNPTLPDLPTTAESGLAALQAVAFFGLVAPAGTPAPVIERLNAELGQVLATELVAEPLQRQGLEVAATSAAEFAAFIAAESARWTQVVRSAGVKVE